MFRHPKKAENLVHNHPASLDPSVHSLHRRQSTAILETITTHSRTAGVRARDSLHLVRQQNPGIVLKMKDVYNHRQRQYRRDLDGCTASGALVKVLDKHNLPYVVKWCEDDPNRLLGVVWSFKRSAELWKKFPRVLGFDNTYGTNYLGYPLFVGVGLTNCHTVFNPCFGLINTEDREGFDFLARAIEELRVQIGASVPEVIITDYDVKQKAAFADEFPFSQQQLCIFHINSNVKKHIREKWIYPQDNDGGGEGQGSGDNGNEDDEHTTKGLFKMWKVVLYAPTGGRFTAAWNALTTEFSEQTSILSYLRTTLLPCKDEWAEYLIKQYANDGMRTTSPNESSNYNLKSYLITGRNNLFRLYNALDQMTQNRYIGYKERLAMERTKIQLTYLGQEYLGQLPTAISWWSLRAIANQHARAMKAIPSPSRPNATLAALGDCTPDKCTVRQQFGLPCAHLIAQKKLAGESLVLGDVDPHWHLEVRLDELDPYTRIRNPLPVPPKGRPRGSGDDLAPRRRRRGRRKKKSRTMPQARGHSRLAASIRRQRSGFEMVEDLDEEVAPDSTPESTPDTAPEPVRKPRRGRAAAAAQAAPETAPEPRNRTRSGRAVKMTEKGAQWASRNGM